MTLIGRVTARCLNLHTVIFQSPLLTEALDRVIVTFQGLFPTPWKLLWIWRRGDRGLESSHPTPIPLHPAARFPPALRLKVDLDLVITVGTVDLD